MRLFVAIELPPRVRTAVEDVTARARRGLPKARWVAAANLHLTLAFLGEVEEGVLPRLAAGLETAIAGFSPFGLRVAGSGCFPSQGRARVAWLGFEPSQEVTSVQRAVTAGLQAAVGFEPDRRPFHPHLTVARCAPPWPAGAARSWAEAVPGTLGEAFRVDAVALIRSRLAPEGAVYSNLHRFSLRGAA